MAVGPVSSAGRIQFGNEFELDTRTYVLRRSGRPLKLERIPMEILLMLLERAGELVTREEIAERVWGKNVFVDTANSINSAIRKIRLVLRDDPDQPRYVQTVVGRGYLFLASQIETNSLPVREPSSASNLADGSLAGRRIGDYRILHLLGAGGMGVVYKAEDLKLGRQVAIKFLPCEIAAEPRALERLEREARFTSALDHPHICSVYQLAQHEGQPFIVMPLLQGQTIREWITAESARPAATCVLEVLKLAIQISDALQCAHENGIIHRDIKPANIFLTNRGEIKILDFGVAIMREAPSESPKLVRSESVVAAEVTRTGLSPGTPAYLSPEQVKGERLDARSDLFSFGSVLYEMATGQRAFHGESVGAIENAIVKVEPRPIRDLKSGFPAGLEQIVAKTLEKDPDQRYQSAAELREDLCTLQAQLAPLSSSALRADPGPNWADRQKRYLIAALIAAVAVLGSLTVLLRKSPGPQPFADFTITQITNTGKADRAAISPDAKYVAHVNDDNGLKSIRLQNISTGSDAEILPPSVTRFSSLVFSPDGNYLYFRKVVNGIGSEWDAFRIPVLGGKPERIARDVDSDIIFSPDGRRISYVRANDPVEGEYRILEANLDGGGETVISIQEIKGFGHEGYPPFAAWSPDGARIVYTFAKMADEPGIVRVLDIQNKHLDTLQHFSDLLTFAVRWLPNPNWLMLVHSPKTGDAAPSQISAFSLLDRRLYPITRDTNSYSSLTLSSDGKTAAAVQTRTISLVDYMPMTSRNHEARRSSLENVNSLDWDVAGNLIFSDGSKLWRMNTITGKTSQLTSDTSGDIVGLSQCSTGFILVNWEYHAGGHGSAIWRLNADGSNSVKLSDGKYDMAPACSPDGRWAYYLDGMHILKRVPVQGGTAEVIPLPVPNLDRVLGTVAFSPDGRSLVALVDSVNPASNRAQPRLAILDVGASHPVLIKSLYPDPRIVAGSLHGGGARFSPDGKALIYAIKESGVGNLWTQPLNGSVGHAITSYTSDLVAQFRFSPGGKTLAIKRTHVTSDIVVLRAAS